MSKMLKSTFDFYLHAKNQLQNQLLSSNQPSFKPGDFCINRYVLLTIFIALSMRASKRFDKVWHEGLLYKWKQNGISGNLLNSVKDFLSLRKQGVLLNGQHSTSVNIDAGFPKDLF